MLFSPIIEKMGAIIAEITAFLRELFSKAVAFFPNLREQIRNGHFWREYRKPAAVAAVIITAILLLAGLGALLTPGSGGAAKNRPDGTVAPETSVQFYIPPDELFLPDEPDFVPGVMTEREKRSAWTEEYAETWWSDPLENGGHNWLGQIEKTADEILESVP